MFKTDTPKNILELDLSVLDNAKSRADLAASDNILNYVYDENCLYKESLPSPIRRYRRSRSIMKLLGLDVSPEYILAAIAEPQAELVIALAGAGKSTLAHSKSINWKLNTTSRIKKDAPLSGSNILALVYNAENSPDLIKNHKKMVDSINNLKMDNVPQIDDFINARTFHSLCIEWITMYEGKLDLFGKSLIQDSVTTKYMIDSIGRAIDQLGEIEGIIANDKSASAFLSLYNLIVETMNENMFWSQEIGDDEKIEILSEYEVFTELNTSIKVIREVFTWYKKYKLLYKKYDFSDALGYMYKLLSTDENARMKFSRMYEYIIADEVQDFTPIMWEILKIANNELGTPLFAIGDDDQSIYKFRGVTTEYLINFKKHFPKSNIYSLVYNRRCAQRIVEEASKVIEMNETRFEKQMLHIREGGSVEYIPYKSILGQAMSITNYIKNSETEESAIGVSVRENLFVSYFCEIFEDEGIPYRVLGAANSYTPFNNEYHRTVLEILDIIENPLDAPYRKNMYKVLPISKEDWYGIIGFNTKTGNYFKGKNVSLHFNNIDFKSYLGRKGVADILAILNTCSDKIETLTMDTYMPRVLELIDKHYWKFRYQTINYADTKKSVFDYSIERAKKLLCQKMTLIEFRRKLQETRLDYKDRQEKRLGVGISTFHRLKGLEFDINIATFMDGDIFPNYEIAKAKQYSDAVLKAMEESDRRLWYVTITRAKYKFLCYYKQNNPSQFVSELTGIYPSIEDSVMSAQSIYELFDKPQESNFIELDNTSIEDKKLLEEMNAFTDAKPSENSIATVSVEIEETPSYEIPDLEMFEEIIETVNTSIEEAKASLEDLESFDKVEEPKDGYNAVEISEVIQKDVNLNETKYNEMERIEIDKNQVKLNETKSNDMKSSEIKPKPAFNPYLASVIKSLGGDQ